ncbi:MAG: hypothetical protein CMJ90_04435 [Planctomycetes bacterium]|nr:hypothetical protein [Planctomycetota bacterium]
MAPAILLRGASEQGIGSLAARGIRGVLYDTGVSILLIALSVMVAEPPDFAREVRPILSRNCFACHGPDAAHREAGLRLDQADGAMAKLASGRVAVRPGDRAGSALWARITHADPSERMPPPASGHELTGDQREVLGRWIDGGGAYTPHWAFSKPAPAPLPTVADAAWPRNAIDAFVLARLERAGLRAAPEADRHTLVRRLSLDITGLPPTPEELDAALRDTSTGWYGNVVRRLLASPRYGERMARPWLDLARYADSTGYASDPLRKISRWRDWVIDAFNSNVPFDRFTIEQMAGDLLPEAATDQILATAFHRNTMTNTEGGTDDEEWRVAAVKDRIETTAQVWMGLTLGCAECHTHKFDPIDHQEYYRFFAFFNQTEDRDLPGDAPRLRTPTEEQQTRLDVLQGEIDALEAKLRVSSDAVVARQAEWERGVRERPSPWTPLVPESTSATGGAQLRILDDDSVLAEGTSPAVATYTMAARTSLRGITAIRIEALTHETLPGKGPGRATNFVLNDLEVTVQREQPRPVNGRFVRIDLPGQGRILSLAEVEIASRGQNVATGKPARQSSVGYNGPAKLAVDGNTSGLYTDGSVTHTATEADPWWEVDLGAVTQVDRVVLWNRTEAPERLAGCVLRVLDADREPVWETVVAAAPRPSVAIDPATFAARAALANATASFSQDQFDVARVIDGDRGGSSGWAVAPRVGKSHVAVFETRTDLGVDGPTRLVFALTQSYGSKHTMGRFRVSITNAPRPVAVLPEAVEAALTVAPSARTPGQREALAEHWRSIDPELAAVHEQLAAKRKARAALPAATTPILKELPEGRRRKTHVLVKGNFLVKGQEVSPGTPAAFHPLPQGTPNRLALARWLVSRENPLTARVMVNRLWATLFGDGLVVTQEDFGSQGSPPSHPELLDWLAVRFMDSGWDVKAMIEFMVSSATYRQRSVATDELRARDPQNVLLARAPRFRLEAEMVRDQALALSGLLSARIGGPSVFPPQPKGLWKAAFNGADRRWPTSMGEDRYRRGIYTFIRRTAPYPAMAVFDAPSREICTPRRVLTNTPLQALVTLNDPCFVECAQALARRIVAEGGDTDDARIHWALKLVTARPAEPAQVRALAALLVAEREAQAGDRKAAVSLATEPLGALPPGLDAVEAAAWTVVANILLNLDAVLVKG